jgi:2-keto-4-pentenoate hydratase/2-oxohepta-3-ene-1,7-dioic acid hydratase in catechol pathway
VHIACIALAGGDTAGVLVDPQRGVALADDVLPGTHPDALSILERHDAPALADALANSSAEFRPLSEVRFLAPYRTPPKIWGIGLNYVDHAADLDAVAPGDEPASFMKGDHTVIGPEDPIPVPWQSERTTAEAELGLVIGRTCRDVSVEEALDFVWGVVPVLDQTAEDILARNPRFLTRAKNFPGFFSFGPRIVPMAEVLDRFGDISAIDVATVHNGEIHRRNVVGNMMFGPAQLVSFHSQVMPLYPGDVISTGTPGAVHILPGDVAECRIEGFGALVNPVIAGPARPPWA